MGGGGGVAVIASDQRERGNRPALDSPPLEKEGREDFIYKRNSAVRSRHVSLAVGSRLRPSASTSELFLVMTEGGEIATAQECFAMTKGAAS